MFLSNNTKILSKEEKKMRDTAIEMAKRLLVDSIWKSANVEGLGTTFPKTEAILANAPTKTTAEEVLFIINMKNAWQFLFESIDFPNNLMLLRQFNQIAGTNMFSHAGEIRKFPVQIGGTSWTPNIPNSGTIIADLEELDKISDAELKALKNFCFIARTQMFPDGNKRVAQLVANKILIENNVGIFQIPLEHLEEFKTLLLEFYETNNDEKILPFLQENCIQRVTKERIEEFYIDQDEID